MSGAIAEAEKVVGDTIKRHGVWAGLSLVLIVIIGWLAIMLSKPVAMNMEATANQGAADRKLMLELVVANANESKEQSKANACVMKDIGRSMKIIADSTKEISAVSRRQESLLQTSMGTVARQEKSLDALDDTIRAFVAKMLNIHPEMQDEHKELLRDVENIERKVNTL